MFQKLRHPLFYFLVLFFLVGRNIFSQETIIDIIRSKKWEDLPNTINSPRDNSQMILIPKGEFTMGLPENLPLAKKLSDAIPEHKVYLDGYYIDKYEVTNEEYLKFVKSTNSKSPLFFSDQRYNHPKQPVVGISYDDAGAYAKWLGKRLPTEAEWEKAARGTDRRLYPWGANFIDSYCNSYDARHNFPQKVGTYPEGASPYGIMDMAGNIAEWVFDTYGRDYYSKSPYKNPRGPGDKSIARITRGGDYKSDPPNVTCVCRFKAGAYSAFPNIGFRCAISITDLENFYRPNDNEGKEDSVVSGITVISKKEDAKSLIPDKRESFSYVKQSSFKKVRYYKDLDFENNKCVGYDEINRAERMSIAYWKVYFDAPGVITQAQFYDQRERLQFHIEPLYDNLGREKELKLFDQKGRLIYRAERIFQEGSPTKGILYSASGDFLGEEKF